MIAFIIRRLLFAIPIALGVTVVCFSLIHLAPGDPLSTVLPDGATAETREAIRAAYGFDQPLPVQYVVWLGNVLSGDFGLSIQSRRPVIGDVLPAVGNTMILAFAAVLIGFTFGIVAGVVAGYAIGTPLDRVVTGVAIAGVSVPHYWLGLVLVVVFAVELQLLPAMGMGRNDFSPFSLESLRHVLLPAITLSVIPAGIIARSVRATVADVRKKEYVATLRAKGLAPTRIFVHVAKNAAPVVLAISGLQFAQLLGGSILVETVFSWPGTGFLMNNAIFTRDLPVLQGAILVLALFFVVVNLAVDVLQTVFDPRIRRT